MTRIDAQLTVDDNESPVDPDDGLRMLWGSAKPAHSAGLKESTDEVREDADPESEDELSDEEDGLVERSPDPSDDSELPSNFLEPDEELSLMDMLESDEDVLSWFEELLKKFENSLADPITLFAGPSALLVSSLPLGVSPPAPLITGAPSATSFGSNCGGPSGLSFEFTFPPPPVDP